IRRLRLVSPGGLQARLRERAEGRRRMVDGHGGRSGSGAGEDLEGGDVKISLATPEVLAFLITLRGYVVFRFLRIDGFRPGESFVKFRDGTRLPQPFYVLARTDRRDWRK